MTHAAWHGSNRLLEVAHMWSLMGAGPERWSRARKTKTIRLWLEPVGGWGVSPNREIVSCRACVRAVPLPSQIAAQNNVVSLSLFPFGPGAFPFSLLTVIPFSLWTVRKPSEIKVKSIEIKVKSSEIK